VARRRKQDTPGTGGKAQPRPYHQHGTTALRGALARLEEPGDWTEALGPVGVALRAWRSDLIEALGGDGVVSPQRRALVEVATRTHLMVESVDRYILAMPCLVNKSKRQLFAVVRERQTLADSLTRQLAQLGLERQAHDVPGIDELSRRLVAEREQEPLPEDPVGPVAEEGAGDTAAGEAPKDVEP
jgi:hypothetical protein